MWSCTCGNVHYPLNRRNSQNFDGKHIKKAHIIPVVTPVFLFHAPACIVNYRLLKKKKKKQNYLCMYWPNPTIQKCVFLASSLDSHVWEVEKDTAALRWSQRAEHTPGLTCWRSLGIDISAFCDITKGFSPLKLHVKDRHYSILGSYEDKHTLYHVNLSWYKSNLFTQNTTLGVTLTAHWFNLFQSFVTLAPDWS